MSTNYIIIKNESENNGLIALEQNVFIELIKNTLIDHEYTNLADASLYKKNINLTYENEQLTVDIDLRVKFGKRVIRVIEDIQKKISEALLLKTNIKSVKVNIGVVGFIF